MNGWDRYWFGDVAAARPWLLQRLVLILLAFDCWVGSQISRGGRYGLGGFNVAHFAILDLIQPMPSPGLYVGLLLLSGLLALGSALTRPSRPIMAVLFALYTWSWAMSMLDSYQHHYLLSLLLLSMVFFPRLTLPELFEMGAGAEEPSGIKTATDVGGTKKQRQKARRKKAKKEAKRASVAELRADAPPETSAVSGPRGRHVSAWAYVMCAVSCAIVYGWTALTKSESDWREGYALRRMPGAVDAFEPFRVGFERHGMGTAAFWEMVGTSVILLQLVICGGYALAVLRDRTRDRFERTFLGVALAFALSFHVGAEVLNLRIGWFSYYMLILALVVLLPEGALRVPLRLLLSARQRIAAFFREDLDEAPNPRVVIALCVAAGLVVGLLARMVDLPGALGAATLVGVALVGAALVGSARGSVTRVRAWALALVVGAGVMWASVASTDVRFDYYRLAGGGYRRTGDYRAALEAYVKANRYAPEGKDRKAREAEMRERVRATEGKGDEQG